MSAVTKIGSLLEQARTMTDRRDRARADAAKAIRAIELRLAEALGGQKLHGAHQLAADAGGGFEGFRVRGEPSAPLPFDARPALVMSAHGRLMMAMRFEDGSLCPEVNVHAWPAEDADFLAEDAERVARVVERALAAHCESLPRAAAKYAGLSMLAHRIEGALR